MNRKCSGWTESYDDKICRSDIIAKTVRDNSVSVLVNFVLSTTRHCR